MEDNRQKQKELLAKLDQAIDNVNVLLLKNIAVQDDSKKANKLITKYRDYINPAFSNTLDKKEYPKVKITGKDLRKTIIASKEPDKWKAFIRHAIEKTIHEKLEEKAKLEKFGKKNSVVDDILKGTKNSKGKGLGFLLFTYIYVQLFV